MRAILHAKVPFWKYLPESLQMYLLDLGKVSFQYLCILDMFHALTKSFVDKISLITFGSTILKLLLMY